MKFLRHLLVLCSFASLSGACSAAAEEWVNLFDGKSLAGWTQRGGTAKYTVEDGAIVGTTTPGSPNSFLCTDKNYGNFILELDFNVDEPLNSGVQIRSESRPDYQKGRVHGYQVEIDPAQNEKWSKKPANLRAGGEEVPAGAEPRRWTGGIYDEGRRGWLNDLSKNEAARKAFKPNEWNHFRIEARGDSIKTWLNDVPAADLKDSMTPSGFIALQVHSSGSKIPLHVRWKNIRIQDLGPNEAEAEASPNPSQGE
jgi:hypothetical protein